MSVGTLKGGCRKKTEGRQQNKRKMKGKTLLLFYDIRTRVSCKSKAPEYTLSTIIFADLAEILECREF